ncbi:MAG TPA: ImmA/IrrE family metallo-endopeptidase [Candidatus Saccharimonadales bacterium]|nr:ImmA/IrrE family metallo-endopeptidase [Candidatus Saccharimonadales bacterium]
MSSSGKPSSSSPAKKTNKSKAQPDQLIARLSQDYPQFKFRPGKSAHWSPRFKAIFYNQSGEAHQRHCGILHELAHAILGHASYGGDFELIKLESEAWVLAAKLGKKYGIAISDDYIQNCLDTYRDWLHRRSTCPACGTHVLQKSTENYQCYNCQTSWHVTSGRFARPYRRQA